MLAIPTPTYRVAAIWRIFHIVITQAPPRDDIQHVAIDQAVNEQSSWLQALEQRTLPHFNQDPGE